MSTAAVGTMTTQEVANRFHELAQSGNWQQIQDELFTDNAESVEPPHSQGMQSAKGRDALKQKGDMFSSMVEAMHGGYSSEPIVAGNHFAVAMGMDVTMKNMGRSKMDEIAVYEVKDGKIVKEQFFY
jgi:hypothetical protein